MIRTGTHAVSKCTATLHKDAGVHHLQNRQWLFTYINKTESFDGVRLDVDGATRATAASAVARFAVRFDTSVDDERVRDEVQTTAAQTRRVHRAAAAAAVVTWYVHVAECVTT